jgi:hypothetical protein
MLIELSFFSHRPRLRVGLTWTTDIIPLVGDIITIPAEFISEWDVKYFYDFSKNYSRDFKVKDRKFQLLLNKTSDIPDIKITLEWNDEEKIEVEKYLKKTHHGNKKHKGE